MPALRTLSFVGVLSALALGPAAAEPPPTVAVAMYTGTGAYGDGPGMLEETFRGTPDLAALSSAQPFTVTGFATAYPTGTGHEAWQEHPSIAFDTRGRLHLA